MDNPERVNQLRPITLGNVVYKIITKVIVSHLEPLLNKIMGHWQATFMLGRQTKDNVIIRHGDHFSPYVFVLCLEYLSNIMNEKVSSKDWICIKASSRGDPFSHLFFANGLIIFAKPTKKMLQSCDRGVKYFFVRTLGKELISLNLKCIALLCD